MTVLSDAFAYSSSPHQYLANVPLDHMNNISSTTGIAYTRLSDPEIMISFTGCSELFCRSTHYEQRSQPPVQPLHHQ
jgi:hypothetical protein